MGAQPAPATRHEFTQHCLTGHIENSLADVGVCGPTQCMQQVRCLFQEQKYLYIQLRKEI